MYIQYRGFKATINARVYSYHVLDPGREQRDLTVEIQSDTNHWASLKLQDGPGICLSGWSASWPRLHRLPMLN